MCPELYVTPSKDIINQYIPVPAFSLFGLLSALLKTSPSFYSGNISITVLMSYMNIATNGNISASYSLLIDVTNFLSFTIYTSVIDIKYSASVLLLGSFLSYYI